ncbi:MAG: DUF5610 domain-containing protein [Zoogloeaceae bacterium]|jgi:hypothetical protein|nr:DUF5610 domain-containing protein [Zoogloeaceae bacterium]
MSIASIAPSSAQEASVQEKPEAAGAERSGFVAKQQLNAQILEASAKVSLTAGNNEQALLFRSAIERINEILAPELGPNALQGAAQQDYTPEATAERIVSISTAFFDSYAKQHPGEDPEETARKFVDLIRGGFEKGFGEARNILEGLRVFEGGVKEGVLKTYDLVHKGYDDFLASKLAALTDPAKAEENAPTR